MKKTILNLLFIFLITAVQAQSNNRIEGDTISIQKRTAGDAILNVKGKVFIRSTANGGNTDSFLVIRNNEVKKVPAAGVGGKDTFSTNPTVIGTTFGKYNDGDVIPAIGKTANEVIAMAVVKAIAPTYTAPTASISASPTQGNYERGSSLSITLGSGFTQNNGGSNTTTTYYQNGGALGSNTTTVSSLTTTQTFYVNRAYGQGACLNNNLGVQDCTGRINAGSVNSSSIAFTPFDKRYYGFVNSNTPGNSIILALTQDNNGSTGSLTLNNITPIGGGQYLAYFTKGTVTSVTVNGFPSTAAFTFSTCSVTNSVGFTSTYTYVVSNNLQTQTISSVIFN